MTQADNNRNTSVSIVIKATREQVYRAFLDPDAVAEWLSPDGMKGHVDVFEPHVGGKLKMSLTYLDQNDRPRGKTSDDTDSSEGTFVEIIPNEKIVQVFEFESDDPAFAGEMRTTWSFIDADGGTEVTVFMENIPTGIRLEDNELGSRQSLQKLAAFVEGGLPNV